MASKTGLIKFNLVEGLNCVHYVTGDGKDKGTYACLFEVLYGVYWKYKDKLKDESNKNAHKQANKKLEEAYIAITRKKPSKPLLTLIDFSLADKCTDWRGVCSAITTLSEKSGLDLWFADNVYIKEQKEKQEPVQRKFFSYLFKSDGVIMMKVSDNFERRVTDSTITQMELSKPKGKSVFVISASTPDPDAPVNRVTDVVKLANPVVYRGTVSVISTFPLIADSLFLAAGPVMVDDVIAASAPKKQQKKTDSDEADFENEVKLDAREAKKSSRINDDQSTQPSKRGKK